MRRIVSRRAFTAHRAAAGALALMLALALAAAAVAAHPRRGAHFRGSFAFVGINGFKAPVSFTVSGDGSSLHGFKYSTLGCFGAGGFRKGIDYYTQPSAVIRVGTVPVSSSGHFRRTAAVSSFTAFGVTTRTTTTVSGTFTSANTATGTVRVSQVLKGKASGTCGARPLRFTAKA
jgi:hypothetical protein